MNELTKKLQVKPGSNWLLFNAPANYLPLIEPLPHGASIVYNTDHLLDGIQLFAKNKEELASSLKIILPLLKPETIFWVIYPKKSSNMQSDFEMMSSWDELYSNGLRVVTSISVDKTWTAFRFKPVDLVKLSDSRNANIKQNEYGDYIDVENKVITLPADIAQELQETPAAMTFYQQLSYSNKKEYVVWILSAKQEKTKLERLEKIVAKLLAGKKNPSEK